MRSKRLRSMLPLLAAVLLLLGTVGCGEEGTVVPTPAPAATPAPTPVPAPAETPAPEAELFVFTRENFPKLDGSTSTAPLAQAVCAVLLGESREEAADLKNHQCLL